MTRDERLHWAVGFALGILARPLPYRWRWKIEGKLNDWAWKREERQNEAGENPNHPLSEHQQAEAKAWGKGYRLSARV